MIIHCLFGKLDDQINLLIAWDEYDVEGNQEGFEDACSEAKKQFWNSKEGPTPEFIRVGMQIPTDVVMERFQAPVIPAVSVPDGLYQTSERLDRDKPTNWMVCLACGNEFIRGESRSPSENPPPCTMCNSTQTRVK